MLSVFAQCNGQSDESIHFESESANQTCSKSKQMLQIAFFHSSTIKNKEAKNQFWANVERFSSTANQRSPFTLKVNQPIRHARNQNKAFFHFSMNRQEAKCVLFCLPCQQAPTEIFVVMSPAGWSGQSSMISGLSFWSVHSSPSTTRVTTGKLTLTA